jgi:hypothetical protein
VYIIEVSSVHSKNPTSSFAVALAGEWRQESEEAMGMVGQIRFKMADHL